MHLHGRSDFHRFTFDITRKCITISNNMRKDSRITYRNSSQPHKSGQQKKKKKKSCEHSFWIQPTHNTKRGSQKKIKIECVRKHREKSKFS